MSKSTDKFYILHAAITLYYLRIILVVVVVICMECPPGYVIVKTARFVAAARPRLEGKGLRGRGERIRSPRGRGGAWRGVAGRETFVTVICSSGQKRSLIKEST